MIDLRSDNVSGIASPIMAALAEANSGPALSYGADAWTARLQTAFADLFEHDCFVQPMTSGTATNALSLALLTPPWSAVVCSEVAHVHDSECGAGEMFTGGAKLIPLATVDGRLEPATLARYLDRVKGAGTSVAPPGLLSLTHGTERGTLYSLDAIGELAAIAKGYGLKVHMDGARFANALAAQGTSPADVTWRHGIDVLSFGATKNGCLAAEAVVAFDPELALPLRYRARKTGHVLSKMRFVSAQLLAYVADGLWLDLAGRANRAAARLATAMAAVPGVTLRHPVEINEIFAHLEAPLRERLGAAGIGFQDRGAGEIRLVTAFDTTDATVDAVAAALHGRGEQ